MRKFLTNLSSPPTGLLPLVLMPTITGIEVLQSIVTLHQMTLVKIEKIVKLSEDDGNRKSNLLEVCCFLQMLQ
jgi:hypothetical protein